MSFNKPYIVRYIRELIWNPLYDPEALCKCGHPYYRHFDSYEDMAPVGCKYCPCFVFEESDEVKLGGVG